MARNPVLDVLKMLLEEENIDPRTGDVLPGFPGYGAGMPGTTNSSAAIVPLISAEDGTDEQIREAVTYEKLLDRELQQNRFRPQLPQRNERLTPRNLERLLQQRQQDPLDYDPILEPGEPEPIAQQFMPGLLSRLAEEDEEYGG